jgi:hypothetical protein
MEAKDTQVQNSSMSRPLIFVQPFGISAEGGGSRILRAMLTNAPIPWESIASTHRSTPPCAIGNETRIGGRPYLGKLERSRLARLAAFLDKWAAANFERQFERFARMVNPIGIHSVAHVCWDTAAAFSVARRLGVPFLISVHDDPAYCIRGRPYAAEFLASAQLAWKGAAARFVISEELGREMGRRWGEAAFDLNTDGVETVTHSPRTFRRNRLHIYFMGLFHIGYEQNLTALEEALQILKSQQQSMDIRITLRCGSLRRSAIRYSDLVEVLPFADESVVQRDLEQADLLYLPLPLSADHVAFSRFSLSTKMITYLGSGRPILYHGPVDAAAGKLLAREQAAIACDSLEPGTLLQALLRAWGSDATIENALHLAQRKFRLADIRKRFWDQISSVLRDRQADLTTSLTK